MGGLRQIELLVSTNMFFGLVRRIAVLISRSYSGAHNPTPPQPQPTQSHPTWLEGNQPTGGHVLAVRYCRTIFSFVRYLYVHQWLEVSICTAMSNIKVGS